MQVRFFLFSSLLLSSVLYAAQPVSLDQIAFPELKKSFFIQTSSDKSIASLPINTLHYISEHEDRHKIRHLRLQQTYAGFLVFGGYAIIHRDPSDRIVRMNGLVFSALEKDLGSPAPEFSRHEKDALNTFIATIHTGKIVKMNVRSIVYMDDDHHGHWAYKVSATVLRDDHIPQHLNAILRADNFTPLLAWDSIKTIEKVQGRGFGGNEKVGMHEYGNDFPLLNIIRDDNGLCYMENTVVKVVDSKFNRTGLNQPITFTCSNGQDGSTMVYWTGYNADGYDRINGAHSTANDAMYYGEVIYDMYTQWYGIPPLVTKTKVPQQLIMRVHYGSHYENAFWDGRQMSFGDGALLFYPLVSLDVAAHEISHGFTEQHANLEYFGQSGGINESFSDMAAQAMQYYLRHENSWTIGEDIIKLGAGFTALRYMDQPSKDGISIDNAMNYRRGMDVHHTSGVFNRLFYLLAHQPGWNTRSAFKVMLKANMDYWTPYSTFNQAACGITYATQDEHLPLDGLYKSFDAVGVDYSLCEGKGHSD